MAQVYEIEVDMRVRKTFRIQGPIDVDAARKAVQNSLTPNGLWASLTHYAPEFGMLRPVERMLDNHPEIISVKAI